MKTRLFASMIAVFFLASMAAAQNYNIRTSFNTNLRNTYSLQGNVVETVPSGTTLLVVGNQSRWLRISRNGVEVWMANWVRFTRVAGGEQTQSPTQTSSNIDNCCFVDRLCSSDSEWTDGYWAFQNGQCTAPPQTQTQTQTSTQTTSTGPSLIDNCCYVDRQCNSDSDWTSGYWAYQNNQCAAPAQSQSPTSSQPVSTDPSNVNNCCFLGWQCNNDQDWQSGFHAYQTNQCKHPGIALEGSPGFVSQMEDALDMLNSRAPQWYTYTIRGLDRIVQDLSSDVPGVHVGGRVFHLDYSNDPPAGYSFDAHTTHNAGMLAHEACHVHRHEAGLEAGGLPGERACLQTQLDVTLEINPSSGWISSYRRSLANIERPECQWWWGEYVSCG